MGASLFLIFSLVFTANLANPAVLISGLTGLDGGTTIGGEVTEIVSASPLQSISVASAVEINNNTADIDLESAPYDDRDPLITGQDSLLSNQNPEGKINGNIQEFKYFRTRPSGKFVFRTVDFTGKRNRK